MTGGSGYDTFRFLEPGDSTVATAGRDRIEDFKHGEDVIDLRTIDANTSAWNDQSFTFIGTKGFTGAGQLRYSTDGTDTYVYANVDANTSPDFALTLKGVHTTLYAADFLL